MVCIAWKLLLIRYSTKLFFNNILSFQRRPFTVVVKHELPPQNHSYLELEDKHKMRALRRSDPKTYTQKTLASMFNVSPLIVAQYAPYPRALKKKRNESILEKHAQKEREEQDSKSRLTLWKEKQLKREHDAWKAKLAAKAEHKVQLRKEKEQRDQEKQRRFLKANPQLAQ